MGPKPVRLGYKIFMVVSSCYSTYTCSLCKDRGLPGVDWGPGAPRAGLWGGVRAAISEAKAEPWDVMEMEGV